MVCWPIRRQASLAVLLSSIISSGLPAQDPAPSALVDVSVKGVIARHGQFDYQWARYKASQVVDASIPQSEKLNFQAEVEFAVKGNKRRSWAMITSGGGKISGWNRETWFIDNGEILTFKGQSEKSHMVTRKHKPFNAQIAPPLEVAGEKNVYRSMTRWLAKDGVVGMKAALTTTPSSETSVVMEWQIPKTKIRNKCSVSPSRGYAVEWYEQYDAKGRLSCRTAISEWITLGGVSYPKRIHNTTGYEAVDKPSWTVVIEVTSLELQARKIPDHLFQVDFPADAELYDVDKQTPIRRTEVSETHLDEVVKRIEKPRTNWWLIGSGSAIGLGIVVLGLYLFRRRRRAAVP